jgi:hypothetical protein
MVEPLRHRQTKEAATDMFYLTPPRHISTLHKADERKPHIHVHFFGVVTVDISDASQIGIRSPTIICLSNLKY